MNNNVVIPKSVIIYGVCVPLAMLMGYLLTTPLDMITLLSVMLVLGLLLVPIFLKWHHAMLIVSWNAVVNAFFLPGQPRVWMVLACASLGFSILQRIMNKKMRLLNVRAVTLPLIALAIVILVTAQLRGGIGLTSMGGGSFGGRKYFEALLAILGFFALSWQKVPPHRAALYVGLFFLAGLTHAISNLAYASGVYWLFWIFPVDYAVAQIQADYSVQDRAFLRLSGVAFACMAPFCFVLARYGVRGSLDFTRNFSFSPFRFRGGFEINQPWRLMALIGAVAVSTYGGFRSVPVLMGLIFIVQFFLERLYKTKLLFMLLGLGFLTAGALLPFSDRLPLGVQRAISFLPVKVNPSVSYDAWAS
ncbi:MAG: hypothetical protein FJ405_17570, partial [Verrucomicrobia bacterium]|nr:hypothetical protein [Verrucomicrobiota bacterium]